MVEIIKKLVVGTMCLGMLVVFAKESNTTCKAAGMLERDTEVITVQSAYTAGSYVNFSISKSGSATVDASVRGKRGNSTKVSLTAEIQKYNKNNNSWNSVKSWKKSEDGGLFLSLSKKYSLKQKGKYRVKLTSKVWNGDDCEKGIVYSCIGAF